MKKNKLNVCIFCGYDKFDLPLYQIDEHGVFLASFQICPSCGAEFGFDDDAGCQISPARFADKVHISNIIDYRRFWINNGMQWSAYSSGLRIPENWNAIEQLKNVPDEFMDDETRDLINKAK